FIQNGLPNRERCLAQNFLVQSPLPYFPFVNPSQFFLCFLAPEIILNLECCLVSLVSLTTLCQGSDDAVYRLRACGWIPNLKRYLESLICISNYRQCVDYANYWLRGGEFIPEFAKFINHS